MDARHDVGGGETRAGTAVKPVHFISDMHLGARYLSDTRAHERRVARFIDSIGADTSHLYILGDALDYWYEYRYVAPQGHLRYFGALARLTDAGVPVTWMTGNHDIWLFDYLRDELGIGVVDAPMLATEILGSRFVLTHGDRVGAQTRGFRLISRLFRSRVAQRMYSAINPWYTIPFALGWSKSSRHSHGDIDRRRVLTAVDSACADILAAYPDTQHIVMGHHHLPLQHDMPGTRADVTVLGDWVERMSYATFDGKELVLTTKSAPEIVL